MINMPIALLRVAASLALASGSRFPVAVVEDVGGNPPGIQFMDYIESGQVIKLGPHDKLVIGYLKSCWLETIVGGTITVGTQQSEVQGGQVERAKTACDGGKMLLTAELANASATAAFRAPPLKKSQAPPRPEFTLYGRSPIVEVKPGGTLVVERIDQPGERYEIAVDANRLTHGCFLDLARSGIALSAGGIYRASAGGRKMVFKIDPGAGSGETPITGRLVRLQPK